MVGWDGETSLSKALTATAGQTTTYGPYYLEQPATINAQFNTVVGGIRLDAKSRWLTVNNPKLAAQRQVFDSLAQNTTVPAAGLFPFLDGYGLYAGQCTTNNPGGTLPNTTPNPGATVTTSPKIRVPSINVRVVNSTSTAAPAAPPASPTTRWSSSLLRRRLRKHVPQPDQHQHQQRRRHASLPRAGLPVRHVHGLRAADGRRTRRRRARDWPYAERTTERPPGRHRDRGEHRQRHSRTQRANGTARSRNTTIGHPCSRIYVRHVRRNRTAHVRDAPPRASDERGFTLIEMLVAMSVGMVILLAAFMLLDRSFTAAGQIADRQDALQRGRQTMELLTRQLRSQVCIGTANVPMVQGLDNSVTFYGNLTENSQSVTKRTLTFDPLRRRTPGRSRSRSSPGPRTPRTRMAFTGAATTTTLMTNVKQVQDGAPLSTGPSSSTTASRRDCPKGDLELLTTPLSTADLGRVALIKIAFRSFAIRPIADDGDSTDLENDVFIRISDPTEVAEGPQCI